MEHDKRKELDITLSEYRKATEVAERDHCLTLARRIAQLCRDIAQDQRRSELMNQTRLQVRLALIGKAS
jgi:hypothetical protein